MSSTGSTSKALAKKTGNSSSEAFFTTSQDIARTPWDPLSSADWDAQNAYPSSIVRIRNDISGFLKDPPPGISIEPDLNCLQRVSALITGPPDTPYQNGFFHFILRFPPDYPIRSPRCRLMTTGNGTVRFNPNLYNNGKVCLSILGTWTGPSWSPAQCLASVLLSIQSLMSEKPYHNEPGFEKERREGAVQAYNDIIRHETLRVAVCEVMEQERSLPKQLRKIAQKQFLQFYPGYVATCEENRKLDGTTMTDPFGSARGSFSYASILARLEKVKSSFDLIVRSAMDDDGDDDDDDEGGQTAPSYPSTTLFNDQDFQEMFGNGDDDDDDDDDDNDNERDGDDEQQIDED